MHTPKELTALFSLEHNIKLYIPSTVDATTEADTREYVDLSLATFSTHFGGATSHEAVGAWNSKTHGLIKENVTIVEAYATSADVKKSILKVVELAQKIKKELKQESVALEYDNKLFLI